MPHPRTGRQAPVRARSRQWARPRRGSYVVPGPQADRYDDEDLRLAALLVSTRREVVVGHAHAARLWGLPRPLGGWGEPVLLTRSGPHRARGGCRIVVCPLPDPDVVQLRGVLVTSLTRTVTDCLRSLPAPDALAIGDAAARQHVPLDQLVVAVDALAGRPGVVAARRLVRLVDGRRESPLESWSALSFDATGVPQPLWQVDVTDEAGFVGRSDAGWDGGVVGESDGKAKYRLRAAELGGADAERLGRVLDAERHREERLRRAGLAVVRWGARDVLDPARAVRPAAYLRQEFAGRDLRRVTATVSAHPVRLPA